MGASGRDWQLSALKSWTSPTFGFFKRLASTVTCSLLSGLDRGFNDLSLKLGCALAIKGIFSIGNWF